MELTQLESFIKVAQLLSFSQAAEFLGYSQSAVTVHIQQLEKEMDVKLFERIGRKVYLSEAGNIFLPNAFAILTQVDIAKQSVELISEPKGELRLGTIESLSVVILPNILLELSRRYPSITVLVITGTTEELIQRLKNHEIDCIYTLDFPVYGEEWIKVFEKHERSVFVGSKEIAHTLNNEVTLKELIEQPFILTQRGASYRRELESMLSSEKLTLQPKLEIANTEIILNLLTRGYGLSFLPEFIIQDHLKQDTIQIIDYPVPDSLIQMQLFYHLNKQVSQVMKVFFELIKEKNGL
ncbi:LysR family transcriptional regulator [Vagococcus vulneris]|uniref:HTH lysR-type domain-containing protein n=1 Tax=Vagococcus vulneris TaxID=1977869 RepID=A0A429ZZD0_9ENTE|nr:LysR family transcriptional regulator [Vagococcus vulneris]RST99354.1 hypothetical protein CBF37_05125 [Vagococcus vulneris]